MEDVSSFFLFSTVLVIFILKYLDLCPEGGLMIIFFIIIDIMFCFVFLCFCLVGLEIGIFEFELNYAFNMGHSEMICCDSGHVICLSKFIRMCSSSCYYLWFRL